MMIFISLLVASLCMLMLHPLLQAPHWLLADQPNERSLHSKPVPRAGGMAVVSALLAGILVLAARFEVPTMMIPALLGGIAIFVVSLADDMFGLGPHSRIVVQLGAALLTLTGGLTLPVLQLGALSLPLPPILGGLLALLVIVWFINLYNFMDGMDGFAGGMGVIGFGCFGLLGWWAEVEWFALVGAGASAACAAFLTVNFPPARMFMGDSGASVLGFLAAVMCLWAEVSGIFPLWIGVLIFGPFTFDATVTLLRRLFAGKRVWEAHREHYYQRLVLTGWSHRRTVLWEYLLMLISAGLALLAVAGGPAWHGPVLVIALLMYVGLAFRLRHI